MLKSLIDCFFSSFLVSSLALTAVSCEAANNTISDGKTIEQAYPGLASISLFSAKLNKLPKGIVLQSADIKITVREIDAEIAKGAKEIKPQLTKNRFFVMEQLATNRLLAKLAKQQAVEQKRDISALSEGDMVLEYFNNIASTAAVNDSEVLSFYNNNRDACGSAKLADLKDQLRQYVLQQKKQSLINNHLRELGKIFPIEASAQWVKTQAVLAQDNPVDKARINGRPTMVDFGADGCRPCDMLTPILEDLKIKYAGVVNIIFVHVRKEEVLAARFGIQSIPVQVFFGRDGKEIFRHTGFWPQKEIEDQFKKMDIH
jgi:thiol-disulfide isomerase/thioredoxin